MLQKASQGFALCKEMIAKPSFITQLNPRNLLLSYKAIKRY